MDNPPPSVAYVHVETLKHPSMYSESQQRQALYVAWWLKRNANCTGRLVLIEPPEV